jgi:hypothetical protein
VGQKAYEHQYRVIKQLKRKAQAFGFTLVHQAEPSENPALVTT